MEIIASWVGDGLRTLATTFVSIVLAGFAFRHYVYRRVRESVETSLKWYAILICTLEDRLRQIDEHLGAHGGLEAVDERLKDLLNKGQADLAAIQIAADDITGSVDLPLMSSSQSMSVARFEASHARLISELQRAISVVERALDRGCLGGDVRYVHFLQGGSSPVFAGAQATDSARALGGSDLKSLLKNHHEDLIGLATEYSGVEEEETKRWFAGETYWVNWTRWSPSQGKANQRSEL